MASKRDTRCRMGYYWGTLIDLSKAFDSIEHSLLLKKLKAIGVSKFATDWFKSYLSERSQSVRIGSTLSEARTTTRGVPQGSILGPALFNIYINDLSSIPNESSLESYVDDSKIYLAFSIQDAEAAASKLTEDLHRIAAWCCFNSLLINPGKTKLLIFGTRHMLKRVPEDFHITVLGAKITPVPFAKDLGVIMDSSLNYNEHISNVVSTCIATLCQINRVKHVLDYQTLITIINTLVFTKLYYCSSVWSNTSKRNIAKLQSVQNFAVRIVTGIRRYDHVTPGLQQLRWLPISYMLKFRDAVMAFKCMNGLAPSYLCDKFISRSEIHNVNTRHNNKLDIPIFKSASGQRTFLYRAVVLWNELPDNIKNSENLVHFKLEYKRILLKNFLDTPS